ncbi:glutamate--tRNA ligase family protein, partial [Clostridioides difficile]|uniref:glutamate--tRNA ligase family protein n=1 Tax=Clostridioides difficile TaxID=1496 RepID=UPI003F8D4136
MNLRKKFSGQIIVISLFLGISIFSMMTGFVFEYTKQKGEYGPYIQSQRLDIYQEYIKQLLDSGKAYYCFCTKERLDE